MSASNARRDLYLCNQRNCHAALQHQSSVHGGVRTALRRQLFRPLLRRPQVQPVIMTCCAFDAACDVCRCRVTLRDRDRIVIRKPERVVAAAAAAAAAPNDDDDDDWMVSCMEMAVSCFVLLASRISQGLPHHVRSHHRRCSNQGAIPFARCSPPRMTAAPLSVCPQAIL